MKNKNKNINAHVLFFLVDSFYLSAPKYIYIVCFNYQSKLSVFLKKGSGFRFDLELTF